MDEEHTDAGSAADTKDRKEGQAKDDPKEGSQKADGK